MRPSVSSIAWGLHKRVISLVGIFPEPVVYGQACLVLPMVTQGLVGTLLSLHMRVGWEATEADFISGSSLMGGRGDSLWLGLTFKFS